jgi:hypothetical protein
MKNLSIVLLHIVGPHNIGSSQHPNKILLKLESRNSYHVLVVRLHRVWYDKIVSLPLLWSLIVWVT